MSILGKVPSISSVILFPHQNLNYAKTNLESITKFAILSQSLQYYFKFDHLSRYFCLHIELCAYILVRSLQASQSKTTAIPIHMYTE